MAMPNPSQLTPPRGFAYLSINFAVYLGFCTKKHYFCIPLKRGNFVSKKK